MKKLLSLLMALALCFGTVPMAMANDDLQQKVDYISSLGIMTGYEDGSFRTDNPITRTEFTAVAARIAGQADSAYPGMYDGRFSDVTPDFWGAGYIALAANMGIINGYTDGTFLPNNNVTYNEAIKMIVCLLGYGLQAEKLGGYPTGYIAVASKLKLLDFKYYEPTAPINRGEVVRLVYNTLDVEIMMTESVGTDGNYVLGKGGTVIEMLLQSETKKGVVTATPLDSLRDDEKISEGFVEINDTLYLTDIDCASFLGERVEYVVTDTDNGEKVIYIKPDVLMKTVTIDKKDVVDVKGIFTSDGQIRYWTENKSVRKILFNASIDVIYNNKVLSYEDAGSIDFGKTPDIYECIDTDGDSTYDLLKLRAYDDNYVKKVYTDGLKQMAVTDSNIAISSDPEDEDLFITVILDGEIVPFEEIKEGDVISHAKSLDSKAYEIIISRESLEGVVTARSEDETEIILTVEDRELAVSETLIEKQRVPALNDSGKFYLSYKGEIAYYEGTDLADGKYGFLTAVGSKGSINANCEVKILEDNNTFSIYPLAKKVKLSDKGYESTKTASEIVSFFYKGDTWDDMRTAYTQIIRYKLNSDGEVNYIATAKETPDEHAFSIAAPNRKRLYSNSLFDQKWKITNDTVVFYIPSTREGEDYTRYRAGTASNYFSSGSTYQVVLYDADENGEVGAVFYSLTGQLREQTFSIDLGSSKVMTIDKVIYKNGDDGNTHCTVSGIVNNNYTSVYVSDEFLSSSTNRNMLEHGNVIQYTTNAAQVKAAHYEGQAEEIVAAILLCDTDITKMKKQWNRTEIIQNSPKMTTVYGIVESIDNTRITISIPDCGIRNSDLSSITEVYAEGGSKFTQIYVSETQKVIKVNKQEKTTDMGTFYDIQPGKKIFLRLRYDKIKDAVVYTD